MLEQSVPEGLHPVEGTYTGEGCGGLSPMGGTHNGAGEECEEPPSEEGRVAETTYDELTAIPILPPPVVVRGRR